MLGDMPHALFGLLALGDVGQNPDVVGRQAAVRVIHPADTNAGRKIDAALLRDFELSVPGTSLCNLVLETLRGFIPVKIDHAKNRVPEQFEGFVTGHQRGGRIDRENAVRFIGKDDAGRVMGEYFFGELFAFSAGPALRNVGVDGDKAAVAQRNAANVECLAVRAGSFELMGLRYFCPAQQRPDNRFRIARTVFAALSIEAEQRLERNLFLLQQAGRQFEQAGKFVVVQRQCLFLAEQADGTWNAVDHGFQQVMLDAQLFLCLLALRNVGVGCDEPGQLLIDEQRFALDQMGAPAGAGAFEAMRFKLQRQGGDALNVCFDVARAVFAACRRNADQVGKRDTVVHRFGRQVQDVEKPLIPDAQAQSFIENTDPLRHVRHDRLEVGVLALGFGSNRPREAGSGPLSDYAVKFDKS